MKKPELLAPAGSPEVLKAAVRYGADAVYMGAEDFGLRAMARNFTDDELKAAIKFSHKHNVKVYVTANVYARNDDIGAAEDFFGRMNEIKPDALLIADPGMFATARRVCPDVDIHMSTQANSTNFETCLFWESLGAKRVVLARELTLREIRDVKEALGKKGPEIECFVHGAMCMAYSGRCFMSSHMTGRDANLGECTHPCRFNYTLVEERRPGEYIPVYEDERGTAIMATGDMCMIKGVKDLIDAGIDSLKVEGRMKSALYVATVVRAYRSAIDAVVNGRPYDEDRYLMELARCTVRPLTTGFYYHMNASDALDLRPGGRDVAQYRYLGFIEGLKDGYGLITQRNKFSVNDDIEIMKTDGNDIKVKVLDMMKEDGTHTGSAPHAKEKIYIRLSELPEEGDVLRCI